MPAPSAGVARRLTTPLPAAFSPSNKHDKSTKTGDRKEEVRDSTHECGIPAEALAQLGLKTGDFVMLSRVFSTSGPLSGMGYASTMSNNFVGGNNATGSNSNPDNGSGGSKIAMTKPIAVIARVVQYSEGTARPDWQGRYPIWLTPMLLENLEALPGTTVINIAGYAPIAPFGTDANLLPANMNLESNMLAPSRAADSPWKSGPPYCHKIVVAVSGNSPSGAVSTALRTYFNKPRMLSVGEAFSCPLRIPPVTKSDRNSGGNVHSSVLGTPQSVPEQVQKQSIMQGIDDDDVEDVLDSSVADNTNIEPPDEKCVHDWAANSDSILTPDPLYGFLFHPVVHFRVTSIEMDADKSSASAAQADENKRLMGEDVGVYCGPVAIDSQRVELMLEGGSSSSTGLRAMRFVAPFFANVAPPKPLLSLKAPERRIVSLLLPSITALSNNMNAMHALNNFALLSTSIHSNSSTVDEDSNLYPPILLLTGARGVGKRALLRGVAEKLGLHIREINAYEEDEPGLVKILNKELPKCAPVLFVIRRFHAFFREADGNPLVLQQIAS